MNYNIGGSEVQAVYYYLYGPEILKLRRELNEVHEMHEFNERSKTTIDKLLH